MPLRKEILRMAVADPALRQDLVRLLLNVSNDGKALARRFWSVSPESHSLPAGQAYAEAMRHSTGLRPAQRRERQFQGEWTKRQRQIAEAKVSPAEFVEQLHKNVDDYYRPSRISHGEFSARNKAIWQAVKAAGEAVEDEVLRLLRDVQRARPRELRTDPPCIVGA